MPIIGLTGGIGTGKSTFARLFLRDFPMRSFDSDLCVHELLEFDPHVRSAIVQTFGPSVCDERGNPSRHQLRSLIFRDDSLRKKLEAILHPRVRNYWTKLAETHRSLNSPLLVDIPLLYETTAARDFDIIIVVAADRKTQIERLTTYRELAPEMAEDIIRAQLDLGTKTEKADHVIWNDSTVSNLDGQTRLLASWLRRRFS